MSDNEFLRELKRDRDEYFTRLVKIHTHQVLREVQYTLRDGQYEGDAEDVAQRVWLKVYLYLKKPLEEIQAIDNIQAWLITIARHETTNYIREKKSLKRGSMSQQSIESLQEEKNFDVVSSDSDKPEEIVRIREELRRVLTALKLFPEKHQQALLLSIEGYSYATIADCLNIDKRYVGNIISTTRKKLREQFPNIF